MDVADEGRGDNTRLVFKVEMMNREIARVCSVPEERHKPQEGHLPHGTTRISCMPSSLQYAKSVELCTAVRKESRRKRVYQLL